MRLFLQFCLFFGPVTTLYAESAEISTDAELVRSYFSALHAKDNSGKIDEAAVRKALNQLKNKFPESPITQFVSEHWEQQLTWHDWDELTAARIHKKREAAKNQTDEDPLIVVLYQVADLLVPIGATDQPKAKLRENAEALTELINDCCFGNEKQQASVVLNMKTLSLVVHASATSQSACEQLLSQLRRQQDFQITYEITLATIPAELANAFSVREVISPAVLTERKQLLQASRKTNIMQSPKVTIFNNQTAVIAVGGIELELHGQLTGDRRATRTELKLKHHNGNMLTSRKFSSSEVIPDGQTAAFFIRTGKTTNPTFDRRLLIEAGVDISPSQEDQLFLFLTPRMIIAEEEEELLGLQQKPQYPAYSQSSPVFPASWSPVKLDWDDGSWGLDFCQKMYFYHNHPWNLKMPHDMLER